MTEQMLKKIHSLIIASSVAMDQETEIPNNLKGTLKDKIHIEDFCYNVQKYKMYKSIQYSEESALRVKVDLRDNTKYDLETNDFILPSTLQDENGTIKSTQNDRSDNTKGAIRKFSTNEKPDENMHKMDEIIKKFEGEKSFEKLINRKFMSKESLKNDLKNFQFSDLEQSKLELIYLIKQLNKNDFIKDILNCIHSIFEGDSDDFEFMISKEFPQLNFENNSNDKSDKKEDKIIQKLSKFFNQLDDNSVVDRMRVIIDSLSRADLKGLIVSFTDKINLKTEEKHKIDLHEFIKVSLDNQNQIDQKILQSSNFSDLIKDQNQNINNVDVGGNQNIKSNEITDNQNVKSTEIDNNQNVKSTEINNNQNIQNVNIHNNHNFQNVEIDNIQNIKSIEINKNRLIKNIINIMNQNENNEGLNKSDKLTINNCRSPINSDIKYYPVNDTTTSKIQSTIENKVKTKLKDFFDQCKNNEDCVLFLSGHGDSNGVNFYLNVMVRAVLNFEDILKLWNERKHKGNSHLLIIIDACYLGKWTEELQWNSKYRNIMDISIQTSSNQYQTSIDGGASTGGCFMNNFLYLNGMRDLFYNYDYKTTDRATGKLKDGQTPTFFSRFDNLETEFRLKIGFNDWESMEKRVRKNFKGNFCGENGEFIEGDFKSIQLHGFGIKKLRNGRIESGHFKNDTLDGHGKIEWEGMTCEGVFVNGILTEDYKGKLSTGENIPDISTPFNGFKFNKLMIDSDIIKEIKVLNVNPLDNVKYEWIKEINQDLSKIEGQSRDNKRHGFNIVYKNNRIDQVGIWQHSHFKKGIKVSEDGSLQKYSLNCIDRYLRDISQNTFDVEKNENYYSEKIVRPKSLLMDMFFANKFWSMWFEGSTKNEYRKADMTFVGNLVSGSKDGLPNGKGTFVQINGVHYDGHWENGLPHGYGHYHNPSTNEAYSGQWNKGLREGFGKMVFCNRECYEGNWQNDRAIGWGKFIDSSENTSVGFIVLKDDQLLLEKPIDDRLYGFTGEYHRIVKHTKITDKLESNITDLQEIISKKNKQLSDYDHQIELIDKKIELLSNTNSTDKKEKKNNKKEIEKLEEEKESFETLKEKVDEQIEKYERIKNDKEQELQKFKMIELDKFSGSVWNNSIFGLCKYTNNLNELIVAEFYNSHMLVRNEVLNDEFSYYEGDVLIDFIDNLKKIPKSQLKNKINSKQKHGIGKLIEYSNDCFEEFDGLFYLNNKQGIGKLNVNKCTNPIFVQQIISQLFNNTTVNPNDNILPSVMSDTQVNQNDNGLPSVMSNTTVNKLMINQSENKNNMRKKFYGLFDKDILISKISVTLSDKSTFNGFALMEKIKFQSTKLHSIYEQNYSNICMYGYGVHRRPMKTHGIYSGIFYKQKREGIGKLNNNKLEYEGSFKSNIFSGKGVLRDKIKKTEYIGDFYSNQKHGHGTLKTSLYEITPNEIIKQKDIIREIIVCDSEYSGDFENDMYSGEGHLVKKYIENMSGIKFHETPFEIITDEFMFNNSDKFIFTMTKSSDDNIKNQSKPSDINTKQELISTDNNIHNQSKSKNNTNNQSKSKNNTDNQSKPTDDKSPSNQIDIYTQSKPTDDKIVSRLKSSDDSIVGRLKFVIFRQAIEKPVFTDNDSALYIEFYFNDYTSISIETDEELLVIKNNVNETNSDQLKCLIDKSNWNEKVFDTDDIYTLNRTLVIDDNLEYFITIHEINNRLMCRVEKVLYQTLECGLKNNKKSSMKFTFVRSINEMYMIDVHTNTDKTQCACIYAVKHLTEIYDGEFYNGEKSGSGKLYQFDGSRYKGEFDKNRFHGEGKLKDIYGVYYEGGFKYGKKDGYGEIQWPCNQSYSGLFKDDLENGQGEFFWDSDNYESVVYKGEFKNGKMHGFGKLIGNNSFCYEGQFKHGDLNGMGTFSETTHNKIFKGIFHYNHLTFSDISIANSETDDNIKGSGAFKPKLFIQIVKHQSKSDPSLDDALIIQNDYYYLFDSNNEYYDDPEIKSKDNKTIKLMDFYSMNGKCKLQFTDADPINVNIVYGAIAGYETITLDDNSVYTGEFLIKVRLEETEETKWSINEHFEFHTIYGYGINIDSNNNIKLGQFCSGEFMKGIMINENVDIIIGNYTNGLLNGECEILYGNGDIYKGKFKNGKKHGKGLLLTKDMIYCGDFDNDSLHGLGQSITCNNQEYIGEFINNKKSGRGQIYYTNDYSYCGSFENDFPSGFGETINKSIDENIFGQFDSGLINGYGEKTFGVNATYEGEYRDDLYDGYGRLEIDNSEYQGHFSKGKYHGYGIFTKPKYTYEGYFENGLKEGYGRITYDNGVTCCGMFKNNKLTGKGKWLNDDEVKEVEFIDSKVVYPNWDGHIKEDWSFTGECWFIPCIVGELDDCEMTNHNQYLQKNIKIQFNSKYTFVGDFNYNFYQKSIEFFDCLYLDLSTLDIINGVLMMSPKNKENIEESGEINKKILKDKLNKNKKLIKNNNINLHDQLFQSVIQNQEKSNKTVSQSINKNEYDVEFDKLMNQSQWTPQLKEKILFYIYFESNSLSFSSLIDESELSEILNYKGTFKNGMWHKGIITYKNGDKLEGKFKNYKIKNIGIKHFNDGSKYEGKFSNNSLNGRGVFKYSNGITYEGYFKNNKKQDFGKLTIPKLGDTFIQTDDDLILYKVKNKKLDNGLVYTGECLVRLKNNIILTDDITFDNCIEFVRITGKGIHSETFTHQKFESVFENDFKLIEEIQNNNKIILKIQNEHSDFSVASIKYSNGFIVRQISIEDQKDVKFIKYHNGDWFIGSSINEERTNTGFMQFNGLRTKLVLFRQDELI